MYRSTKDQQNGQAMIETLIACALVLVPLFLAIPMLAKYMDIQSYVVQAARYAAWERTVWFGGDAAKVMGLSSSTITSNKWDANAKSDNTLRAEIGRRLLSETSGTAFSASDQAGAAYVGGPRHLWRDRSGAPLLANYADIGATITNKTAPGVINILLGPLMQFTSIFSSFTVDTSANYTADIGLSVQRVAFNTEAGLGRCPGCTLDFAVAGTPMNFTQKNVILANGWSANGPGSATAPRSEKNRISAYNQISGLTPTSILNPNPNYGLASSVFKTIIDVFKGIALVFFPEVSTLELGKVDIDKVPDDRLQ